MDEFSFEMDITEELDKTDYTDETFDPDYEDTAYIEERRQNGGL